MTRWLALPFAAYAVVLLGYTGGAIHQSSTRCAAYPQCVSYAHQINLKDSGCPCIALVDRHLVSSIAEWEAIGDYTAVARTLSSRGFLQTVEIVNRKLQTLPEEMRACKHIQEL